MKWRVWGAGLAGMALCATAAAQSTNKKIQCWTDDTGARMCGDRVPPEYADKKRDVISQGRVVETVKAAKTPEEFAEERRKKQEAEEAKRRADYDRALLETYRSAKDIEAMRDERIALLDSRINAAEKNAATTEKSLAGLRARAEAQTKEGKPVDARLAKQIKEFEKDQKQSQRALARNREERAEIEKRFNADLERYNQLRGTKAPEKPATAATPATPATPGATPSQPAQPPAPSKS